MLGFSQSSKCVLVLALHSQTEREFCCLFFFVASRKSAKKRVCVVWYDHDLFSKEKAIAGRIHTHSTRTKRHFFWSVRSVTLAPPLNNARDDGCWWFLRSRDAFVESQQKTVVEEISVANAHEQKRRAKVIVVGVDQKENDDDVDEE